MSDELGVSLADGELLAIDARPGSCTLVVRDWREQTHALTFTGVVAVEALSPFGTDLSHAAWDAACPALERARAASDEVELRAFCLYGAWSPGRAIVTVVIDATGRLSTGP